MKGIIMEVSLANLERHSMLFIGSISLTSENPGPVSIDVDALTKEEAFQVLFNIQKGVLSATGGLENLQSKLNIEEVVAKIEAPVVDEKETILKKILSRRVNTIKKETAVLNISDLKKVMALEKNGKNRKSVVVFLDGLYATHAEQVAEKLKSMQNNSEKEGLDAQTFLDDLPSVLELEEEEVEFTLPNKE
jgi:viroplasmin and RNaseH domain-containing protein